MISIQSYGRLVRVHWWMFRRSEREFTTFHRVTWSKSVFPLFFIFCSGFFFPCNFLPSFVHNFALKIVFVSLFFMGFLFCFDFGYNISLFGVLNGFPPLGFDDLVGSINKSGIKSEDTNV